MVCAIRIAAFADTEEFKKRLKETADRVRALEQSDDADDVVMVPGDPEKRAALERMTNGIPVPRDVWARLA